MSQMFFIAFFCFCFFIYKLRIEVRNWKKNNSGFWIDFGE